MPPDALIVVPAGIVNDPPDFTINPLVKLYSVEATKVTSPVISPAKFSVVEAPLFSKPVDQPAAHVGAAARFQRL